jgi:uncharacterized protein (TIGR03000 family)
MFVPAVFGLALLSMSASNVLAQKGGGGKGGGGGARPAGGGGAKPGGGAISRPPVSGGAVSRPPVSGGAISRPPVTSGARPAVSGGVNRGTTHAGNMNHNHQGHNHNHQGHNHNHHNHNHHSFYYPYLPFSFGLGYGLGGYGYGYGSSYYNDYPLYNYSYPQAYSAQPYYYVPQESFADPVNKPAYIEVRLPDPDGQVFLDGNRTSSTGATRVYNSPALAPGEYSYEVTAIWKQDGRDVRVTRTIRVVPGRTTLVDFTQIDTKDRVPPKPMPGPDAK